MKKDAEEMLQRAYSVAEVCNQILAEEKNLNPKFMAFLDREGKRTGKQSREYVEYLYKKFQKERRGSLSDWQLEMLQVREGRRQQNSTNTDYIPDIIDTGTGIATKSIQTGLPKRKLYVILVFVGNQRAKAAYPPLSEGLTLQTKERGGLPVITYEEFFLFCTFIVALISLFYQIFKDRK